MIPNTNQKTLKWDQLSIAASQRIKEKEYWLAKLSGQWEKSHFPYDYNKKNNEFSSTYSSDLETVDFEFPSHLSSALIRLSSNSDVRLHIILTAGLTALLYRYLEIDTGIDTQEYGSPGGEIEGDGENGSDIVLGAPISKANTDAELINTLLVLRNQVRRSMSFKELLLQVRQTSAEGIENQNYPMEILAQQLNIPISPGNDFSLFDIALLLENIHDKKYLSSINLKMILSFLREGDDLRGRWEYNPLLYREASIRQLIKQFLHLFQEVTTNVEVRLFNLRLMSPREKKQLLIDFNDTAVDYPTNATIHDLFTEQVEKRPDAAAVVGLTPGVTGRTGRTSLTYRQVNEKSNQLAHWLRQKGVKPDTLVGILVERSLEMLIGILGILKAGGAYMPIDPRYPQKRINYMLKDCLPLVLLTRSQGKTKTRFPGEQLYLDAPQQYESPTARENPVNINKASDLAYVMYTSGSTGRSKGVLVVHYNVLRLVIGANYAALNQETRILQTGASVFDATTFEIWGTLLNGGELYLADNEVIIDADKLAKALAENNINTLWLSSPLFNQLMQRNSDIFSGLEYLLVGGDVLSPRYINMVRAKNKQLKVINGYGRTENTTISACYLIDKDFDGPIPIGRPINNSTAYILNAHGDLQPPGIFGELNVGGHGISRGYLNQPELTAEKFGQDLWDLQDYQDFQKKEIWKKSPGKKDYRSYRSHRSYIYRTGDLARWNPDGSIEFLGRLDNQVKIRGFRVEPREIEDRLLKHPQVKEALVIVKEKNGTGPGAEKEDKYLCAYWTANFMETSLSASQLREYLAAELPDYMIPTYFIALEKIPLNPNGKVDFKGLPQPGIAEIRQDYSPPRDQVEQRLVEIWSQVLKIDKTVIGIDDNFFERGGHSLKATTLAYRLFEEFQVNFEIEEVFVHPTIRELAQRIRKSEISGYQEILPVEEKEYYELSYAQRRLWVLCQFEEDSTAYNIPGAVMLSGPLQVEVFEKAIQVLVNRHESLKTVFSAVNGETYQRISKNLQYNLQYLDLSRLDLNEEEKTGKTREIYREHANNAFNLEKWPLFRFGLIRLEPGKYVLMYNIHHIISDGWSQGIIHNETIQLYNTLLAGKENSLPALRLQYKDYTYWHNHITETGYFNVSREYWLEKFKDKPNGIELPLDYPRKPIQTFNGGRVAFTIDKERTSRLYHLSLQEDATFFMSLLTLVCVFFYRYSGQTDIIIGAPIANRKHPGLHQMIGFLVNTLIYRNRVTPGESFKELLGKVKQDALACYKYQDFPFDLLVEQLGLDRDLSQSPLFNIMLAHNNTGTEDIELVMEGITSSAYQYSSDFNMSKFDLIFFMDELDNQVYTRIEYNSDLFEDSTIQRMADNFLTLLDSVIADYDAPVSGMKILSDTQYDQVISQFNDTDYSFPQLNLQELFEQQVEKSGEKTAVVWNGDKITYNNLNKKVNRLAHYLRKKYRIKPNNIIGVSLDRSIDMIVALLGIIKSGAAYLALDPTYPRERVLHVLNHSRSDLLMIDKMRPELFENYTGEILNIYDCREEINRESDLDPEPVNQPADILYVNYTSGSTGIPNGAMLSHDCLTNLIQWQTQRTTIDCSLRCLQFTSINFCVSFQEIMGTLTSGGELYLIGDIERQDIDYLMNFLSRNRIEILFLPFSYLNFLFNESGRWHQAFDHNLKHIITAGEQLKITVGLKRFLDKNPHLKLHNHYGSTEMHVVTSYTLDASNAEKTPIPPAGKPVSNISIYILDEYFNPVPVGVWGELFVAGSSEILGYIDNDALNKQKLVKHPWLSTWHHDQRFFRSGDIGRWMPDGNIELRGRKDFQVKIRGFRIEPGEIESKILSIENVRECVVVVKEDKVQQKYLAAYVSVDNIKVADIKKRLSGELPQYMIPQIILLDNLPLMPNGKVDRERLPEPEAETQTDYTAPRDELEKGLVKMWSQVLEIAPENIGIDNDFFELGGHSLKATVLVSRLHKELQVKVRLLDIFQGSTIRELAEVIKGTTREQYAPINITEAKEYYSLSSAQKRLYLLQQIGNAGTAYNMPFVMELTGNLNRAHLEDTFKKLIQRHESFRTSFVLAGGEPVQCIHDEAGFELEYFDLQAAGGEEGPESRELRIKNYIFSFIRPFDLSRAPLLRVGLIRLKKEKHILAIDMHHIISDGTSCGILVREFMALYAAEELTNLKLQYSDYSDWQANEKRKEELARQETYWKQQFADELPVLDLPTDFPRPTTQVFEGKHVHFEIGKETTTALMTLALAQETTLYMVLLTIYNIFLSKLSGQEDIVVGTAAGGRKHADLEGIIGMFVNTLVLRNYPRGHQSFLEFLKEIKERTIEAFDHQDYQYEDLVSQVLAARDTSRNPLFDTMFVIQNTAIPTIRIKELNLTPFEYQHDISKFDLMLLGSETDETLSFTMEYSTRLFTGDTIRRFIGYFNKIVTTVIGDPAVKLSGIAIISPEEKQQILEEFNNTRREYPGEKTIHRLFEEQVQQTPDHIALMWVYQTHENREKNYNLSNTSYTSYMSYKELNNKSNQLAQLLKEKGLQPDTIVGIMLERSAAMVLGLLGILKTGGAYLPIDPACPPERVDFLLKDSNARILLKKSGIQNPKPETNPNDSNSNDQNKRAGAAVLDFETLDFEFVSNFDIRISNLHSSSLAYIIYTSGSTGKPKGVMVEHHNVVRLVKNADYVEFKENQKILQTGALEFDASTFEIWGALLNGLSLYLVDKGQILNPERLKDTITRHNISTMWMTSPLFNQMVQADVEIFAGLTNLLVGGDALSPSHISRVRTRFPALNVINGYGPTENTTFSTTFLIDKEYANIPIGSPIANSTVIIIDKNYHFQPVKVAGELCVGGDGVSRGYLNDPELTNEKFLMLNDKLYMSHMSHTSNLSHMSYIYKTGDLARWLPDGNIEFSGRIDHQVKLRGFRVEPGEIENRLLSCQGIKNAVVLVKQNQNQEKYLCAYVVPDSRHSPTAAASLGEELKKHLQQTLPNYMVPAYFITLNRLPLTPNGKIDRKALPEPEAPAAGGQITAPQNATQEKLVLIWAEILSIPSSKISIDSDFFELGGHSLKALQILNAVQKEFNVKIDFQDIFQYPTIAELSALIQKSRKTGDNQIEIQPRKEYYELSYTQQRLWYLYLMDPDNPAFNLPTRITLYERMDETIIRKVLEKLVQRHESFRIYFRTIKNEAVQLIQSQILLHLETFDLSHLESRAREEKRAQLFKEESIKPFNLEVPPLARMKLIKCSDNEFDVILTMHHIITDGWSMEILEREFTQIYESYKTGGECNLELLKNSYIDYAYWQAGLIADKEKMQGAREFWEKQLQGDSPPLDLPYDFNKKDTSDKESAGYRFVIPEEILSDLKKIAREQKASLFMVLLAGFNVFLYQVTRNHDILLAVPGAARQHEDLKHIVGFFVNTLVLKSKINPHETFIDFLAKVQDNTFQALEYQSFPLELICSQLKIKYPDISVFFNMINLGSTQQVTLTRLENRHMEKVQDTKFDIVCYIKEFKNGIEIICNYFKNRFKPISIERLMDLYKKTLDQICKEPGKKLEEYGFTPKKKILKRHN